ncbi:MerR family transcriptional regulator [Noviherbaspirillum massiliense]|uniref:MerR family transcriptional regulator n=1 Tax=Noviherbaspirillum massiliense TaxID=1465823 RepID=UPI0003041A7D|nr:helix-turn-helix domain-containing protein [Noviherbaspirillum massiliense]
MDSENLTIGALAARTQCSVPTIRYYEEIGLLPQAARGANGRRYYREADQKRLVFIRRCRDFGFAIEQVRGLVGLFENGDRPCAEAREMAQDHLITVRTRIEELRQLEQNLLACVQSCDDACIGGPVRECTIMDDLSQAAGQSAQSCGNGMSEGAGADTPGFIEVRRR